MRLIKYLLLLIPTISFAGPYYELNTNTTTGTALMRVSGNIGIAASSNTPTNYVIKLDGVNSRVGIGKSNPSYPLDVIGDVNITGLYRINGVAISTGGSGGYTSFVIDDFTSQTNGSQTQFTLSQQPLPNSLQVSKNGLVLKSTADYSLSGQVITMVTAPSSNTALMAQYAVGISTTEKQLLVSTNSWSATNTFNNNTIFNSSISINSNSTQQYALTIDTNSNSSDGYIVSISTNGIPKFTAYKTTNQSINTGAIDPVLFDVVEINNHFSYSSSNGRIYFKESGYYFISGNITSLCTFGIAYMGVGIYKNSSQLYFISKYVGFTANNHYFDNQFSYLGYFNAGEYIEISYYHGGGTQTITYTSQGGYYPTRVNILKIL